MSRTTDAVSSRKKTRPRSSAQDLESPAARRMRQLTDLGLAAVIFVAPLFMGGRYDVGRLAYVACVCIAAIGWLGRLCLVKEARWRLTGAEPLLLGGLLLLFVQLMPLPPVVLNTVSPEIGRLLPLWGLEAGEPQGSGTSSSLTGNQESQPRLGTWNQLSLTPQATQAGMVTFLAHCLLFLVVVQRIRDRRDVERLLRWLALSAIAMAALGIAQLLAGNGKFLWIYEHPSRDTYGAVKGTFQNQNHFAHFLILGLAPLFWWLQRLWAAQPAQAGGFGGRARGRQQLAKPALLIGTGLVLVAIFLTFSRGGVISALVACTISLSLMAARGLLGRKALLSFAGLTLVMVGALTIHGYEPLARRLSTLRYSASLEELSHGRKELWEAHLTAIPRFLWTGAGAGSHREIYKTYLDESFDVEFTHGENGYLHLMLEMGIPGLALMLSGVLLAGAWCWRAYRHPADSAYASAAVVVLAGLGASLVHSLGDFVWYIPACLSLTIILAACGCRIYQLNRYRVTSKRSDRVVWRSRMRHVSPRIALALTGTFAALAAMMLADRLPPALAAPQWDAYFKLSRAEQAAQRDGQESSAEGVKQMVAHLQQLLQRDPHNGRAHLRLARLCLREFDLQQAQSANPMPLTQIRDAALASQFPTQESLDNWLHAVVGDNRIWLDRARWHTRQALTLCPLQGDGYVHLAELGFLDGAGAEAKRAYVQQALTVQPYSGLVLMAAGGESALAGDTEQALALWKRAFHQDPQQQGQIIEMLAAQMPPKAFLEFFEPDLDAIGRLYSFYRRENLIPQALEVGGDYARELATVAANEEGERAAADWSRAAGVYQFLEDADRFAECAQKAVDFAPDDLGRRRLLAKALVGTKQYDEAVRQLQWCASRRPEDVQLKRELQSVARLRLTNQQVRQ